MGFTCLRAGPCVIRYPPLLDRPLDPVRYPNASAGREHVFKAYRVAGDPADAVTLCARTRGAPCGERWAQ